MEAGHTSVEEQVEYGLTGMDANRTVEVPLLDLLYVHQTLGEFIRFFHNPSHYPDLAAIERFLGNRNDGAFKLICDCYYQKIPRSSVHN